MAARHAKKLGLMKTVRFIRDDHVSFARSRARARTQASESPFDVRELSCSRRTECDLNEDLCRAA